MRETSARLVIVMADLLTCGPHVLGVADRGLWAVVVVSVPSAGEGDE